MRVLYLAWQHPQNRFWFPVGRLTEQDGQYTFAYTKGALASTDFFPFGRMTDLNAVYRSDALFPLFANRVLSRSRPEYDDYLRWLNLADEGNSPIALLSRSGGLRGTDSLQVFSEPQRSEDGRYEFVFLSHGLRHLPALAIERCDLLLAGEPLFLLADLQNDKDSDALAIRTSPPIVLVGFCPRYLVKDFGYLLSVNGPSQISVRVERVNPDAPLQFRLLCRFSSPWPDGFAPFSHEWFAPIANIGSSTDPVPFERSAKSVEQAT